jgi:uncharacterized protein (DUF1800 family)
MERTTTRRALLAGTATLAAAGAAAAIVGVVEQSGGGGSKKDESAKGAVATTKAVKNLDAPIDDPKRRAAHLLRRAGFGGTQAEIDAFAKLSREDAADRLVNYETIDNSALDARLLKGGFDFTYSQNQLVRAIFNMQRWWLTRMAYTARPLEERMTLIWHGLLTSQVSKVGVPFSKLMLAQNELFRTNALGKYDSLVKAVSRDPAMLYYLDNIESTKAHPNENYARELMELFTLGEGHYTEQDIRESARSFTGWRVTPPTRTGDNERDIATWNPVFFVQPAQHDTGAKTFMGKTGNFNGDDIVDIIMEQPQAGRFLCTRLFTEFANYNPDKKTIDKLVAVWESSGHRVKDIVRAILVSDEFYSERSYRGFVRSPVELLVGAVRALQIETDFTPIATQEFRTMDQTLFEPPNVAGWPGGSVWLSSSTFYARANFLDTFLFRRNRPIELPALAGAPTPQTMADVALKVLVDDNVAADARKSITEYAGTVTNPTERAAAVAYLVLASPEYQLI